MALPFDQNVFFVSLTIKEIFLSRPGVSLLTCNYYHTCAGLSFLIACRSDS